MDEKSIELHLNDHDNKIENLHHRVKNVEQKQEALLELATSVKELSINMKYMVEEQQRQGERLEALEKAPADEAKYIRRQIIGAIISALIGAGIGALLALIIK